jgi:alkylhydroperoxidase/carboxymuconolactone decarboxylase family protein YurZ
MSGEDDAWMAEWERMTGRVSDTARELHEMNPVAEASYRTLRSWIYEERPDGLPRAYKELVMVVMNASNGRKDGAIRHLSNGLKHGLTVTQVREALSLCFLFLGVSWFLETGQAIWHACNEAAGQSGISGGAASR